MIRYQIDMNITTMISWRPTYQGECRSNGWLARWQDLRRRGTPEQHWETLLLATFLLSFLLTVNIILAVTMVRLPDWLDNPHTKVKVGESDYCHLHFHHDLLPWGCVASCAMQDPAHEMTPLVILFVSRGRSLGEKEREINMLHSINKKDVSKEHWYWVVGTPDMLGWVKKLKSVLLGVTASASINQH